MADSEELASLNQLLPETLEEQLTREFYEWELRGRGWRLWDCPVELEPPFRPFFYHSRSQQLPADDGRKSTFLSSIVDSFRKSRARNSDSPPRIDEQESSPVPFRSFEDLVEIKVALPANQSVSAEVMERLVLALRYCAHPLSFETIGLSKVINMQLTARRPDAAQLRQQLRAYFPTAVLRETEGFLRDLWADSASDSIIVDFGLANEFMLPLHTFKGFEVDPLVGLTGALAELAPGEIGVLQVLFQPVRNHWPESIMRAVTDGTGGAFFAGAPEMLPLTKQKIGSPLFAVAVRVAVQSGTHNRSMEIARAMGGVLSQFSDPMGNELIPLDNHGYSNEDHQQDLVLRLTHRSGMILNSDELVSLVHLPSVSVRSEKLSREERRSKAAPPLSVGHRVVLGENAHAGRTTLVTLSPEQRMRHTYIIGASGTGKSTLLLNLIKQDIDNGEGLAVLDPHGDLIDQVVPHIPESRHSDVLLLDPSDEEYPIGFNILSAHSELEKNLLASDLVAVFRRLSTSWGDQMTSVLGNAILAVLESERGGTLADLRRFLVEPDFRKSFLSTLKDPEITYYWQKEFPLLTGKPQAPLLTRLDTFLRPKLIRLMVCQKENRLDFGSIMNEGKIFLAKLSQGAIGEENAYLLGSLLVSKLHQMAMSRQSLSESQRRNFYLYVDEFHNFITPSMASILSGARKYHLGLILAHQELRQLWNKDTDVASAVISNPCTRVCFRLGDFDAQKLKDGFSFFDAKDLQNPRVGEAIVRIERAENDFNLKTLPLLQMDDRIIQTRRQAIISLSRQRYARARADVEAEMPRSPAVVINERSAAPPAEPAKIEREKSVLQPKSKPPEIIKPVTDSKVATEHRPNLVSEPPLLGRGGPEHKYLQDLIKRMAENKGFRVVIEEPVFGGLGSIDVALYKGERKIACEISVTTGTAHEMGNIQKCVAAGYNPIIFVSTESKALSKVKASATASLESETCKRLLFQMPVELFQYLEQLAAEEQSSETTIRGRRVKVLYKAVSEDDAKLRKQAIARTIFESMKKLKKMG